MMNPNAKPDHTHPDPGGFFLVVAIALLVFVGIYEVKRINQRLSHMEYVVNTLLYGEKR